MLRTLGIFVVLAVLFVTKAFGQVYPGEPPIPVLYPPQSAPETDSCKRSAREYLKEAEENYTNTQKYIRNPYNSMLITYYATTATAGTLLYQICSELEKNASPMPPPPLPQ